MLQRYVKPALLVVLVVLVAIAAVATSRGMHYTDPFVLGRFADFAANSPLLSTLLLLVLLPGALVVLLLPESAAVTLAVSDLGFWPGFILSLFCLCAAGVTTCVVARVLSHPLARRYMAARRALGRSLARTSVLPLEYCLLLSAFLLILGVPVTVTGFVLGIAGMRGKAFLTAAFPFLFVRASMQALATREAGFLTLVPLAVIGTLLALAFLYWLALILRKRLAADRRRGVLGAQDVLSEGERKNPSRRAAPDFEIPEMDDVDPGYARGNALALGGVVLVCVSDLDHEDEAALVAREADALDMRVLHVSMDRGSAAPATGANGIPVRAPAVLGGFEGVERVADLDEIVSRAFNEGAGVVLAVHAVTPLLRRDLLARARDRAESSGLVLGATPKGLYLVGLSRVFRNASYDRGSLSGMDFTSDVAFALTGFAPHPHMLPELPTSAGLRPLASVVVVCDAGALGRVARTEEKASAMASPLAAALTSTVHRAKNGPFSDVHVALLAPAPGDPRRDAATDILAGALSDAAAAADARLLSLTSFTGLDAELGSMRGTYVLAVRLGILLPENWDEAVWITMHQERCVLGGFNLPPETPPLKRFLAFLGSSVKPGSLTGPTLDQGLFTTREDWLANGGLTRALEDIREAGKGDAKADPTPDELVARLVERISRTGRVVLHNGRVRLCGETVPGLESADGDTGLLAGAKQQLSGLLSRLSSSEGPDASSLLAEAESLVASCDHCGRCTHVCPVLRKHGLDLADLPAHPLLAWHCFLCGACTAVCHLRLDAVDLVRLLRRAHVRRHGDRLARPGHVRTLALSKVRPYARAAAPGRNLLLDASFCAGYPATARALVERVQAAGVGVILAETGAACADLGLESTWKKTTAALRRVMEERGVTGFYTVGPDSHRFLVAMGFDAEPVYGLLTRLPSDPVRPADAAGLRMLVPCSDTRRVFDRAARPLLAGGVSDIEVLCCGGGGEAAVLEPAVAREMKDRVRASLGRGERVVTTCAGCAVTLTRAGIPAEHLLSTLLGVREKAQTGVGSLKALGETLLGIAGLGRDREEERAAAAGAPAAGEPVEGDATVVSASLDGACGSDGADGSPLVGSSFSTRSSSAGNDSGANDLFGAASDAPLTLGTPEVAQTRPARRSAAGFLTNLADRLGGALGSVVRRRRGAGAAQKGAGDGVGAADAHAGAGQAAPGLDLRMDDMTRDGGTPDNAWNVEGPADGTASSDRNALYGGNDSPDQVAPSDQAVPFDLSNPLDQDNPISQSGSMTPTAPTEEAGPADPVRVADDGPAGHGNEGSDGAVARSLESPRSPRPVLFDRPARDTGAIPSKGQGAKAESSAIEADGRASGQPEKPQVVLEENPKENNRISDAAGVRATVSAPSVRPADAKGAKGARRVVLSSAQGKKPVVHVTLNTRPVQTGGSGTGAHSAPRISVAAPKAGAAPRITGQVVNVRPATATKASPVTDGAIEAGRVGGTGAGQSGPVANASVQTASVQTASVRTAASEAAPAGNGAAAAADRPQDTAAAARDARRKFVMTTRPRVAVPLSSYVGGAKSDGSGESQENGKS